MYHYQMPRYSEYPIYYHQHLQQHQQQLQVSAAAAATAAAVAVNGLSFTSQAGGDHKPLAEANERLQSEQQQSQQHQHQQQQEAVGNSSCSPSSSSSNQHQHNHHQEQHNQHQLHHCRKNGRGKSKRIRTIFTPEQLKRLEEEFSHQMYLVGHDRCFLASSLHLTEAQVKVWFQNRRIKFRKLNPASHHQELESNEKINSSSSSY